MSGIDVRPLFEAVADGPPVVGYLHQPPDTPSDGLVLTHGAGSDCQSRLLVAVADAFCASGIAVLRCNLPFRQLRPHAPPMRGSAELDQKGLRNALESLKRRVPGRLYLGGHSYGGRQSTMLAAAQPDLVEALLLLSYPLHPAGKPQQLRTSHFPDLRTPACFIHGSKDALGTLAEMKEAIQLIPARTSLTVIDGAGHELASARTLEAVTATIRKAWQSMLAEVPKNP